MGVKFDYSKLKGRIVERFGSVTKFAAVTGVKVNTLNVTLRKGAPLKGHLLYKFAEVLEITQAEIPTYFFVPKF